VPQDLSVVHGMVLSVSRYRLDPTPDQVVGLLKHCEHARYMWNLALEQWGMWVQGRGPTPGFAEHCRQLTEARTAEPWLAAGSQTVQQQALRDFDQARKRFFDGGNRRPTWRRSGVHEGFRVVGAGAQRVEKLNRKWARVLVPKVGWVKFRVERTTTDLARRFDVIRVEDLKVHSMTRSPRGTIERPGRNVRRKAGLNRSILASGWGLLVARLEQKAPGRVEKVNAAYTSLTCSVCGHCVPENRESQAVFRCVACTYRVNADVNAARNIAAGRAVSARRETGVSTKREPQSAASA